MAKLRKEQREALVASLDELVEASTVHLEAAIVAVEDAESEHATELARLAAAIATTHALLTISLRLEQLVTLAAFLALPEYAPYVDVEEDDDGGAR